MRNRSGLRFQTCGIGKVDQLYLSDLAWLSLIWKLNRDCSVLGYRYRNRFGRNLNLGIKSKAIGIHHLSGCVHVE